MPKDLTGFINYLREVYPSDLLEIKRTVNPNTYDCTAILEQLTNQDRFPVVHFRSALNLRGEVSEYSFLSNMYGTRERCATALNFPREQSKLALSLEFARRELGELKAKTIPANEAPVKQVVEAGDQADLRTLPIARHYAMDLGPYTTMACVMKDPDEGFYDVSFIKWLYKGPRRAGVVIHSSHFMQLLAKYEKRGRRAPVINVLGHHPAFYLASLAVASFGTNDYDHVGAFLDEPLRLTPSQTWGADFLVPADAEIIVEAEIVPGERVVVNPFGEFDRIYQAQTLRPVGEVTAITHRRQAIYQDIFSGHQGHWNLGGIPKEGAVYNAIKAKFDGVGAVCMPHSAASRTSCYISIKKDSPHRVREVAEIAAANVGFIRVVVVVDDDVDPFNETDIVWATVVWAMPRRALSVIEIPGSGSRARPRSVIVVDATRPTDVAVPARIKVPDEAMARVRLEDYI